MANVRIGTDLTSPVSILGPYDLTVCSFNYGRDLVSRECLQVANTLPRSNQDFPYPTKPQRWALPLFQLPMTIVQGGCYISIEVAGPTVPDVILVAPSAFRTLAAQVIQKCVGEYGRIGGFTTYRMGPLFDFLLANDPSPAHPIPSSTAFITLTVSGPSGELMDPGNKDPVIPSYLADLFDAQAEETPLDNVKYWRDTLWAEFFRSRSLGDGQGWVLSDSAQISAAVASNEMAYECDTNLGAPNVVDCGGIEWEHVLGSDSDTITVGPGQATFLHKNSCYMAITASIALVLTWAQIRVALSALMTTCIQNPLNIHPQGGKAFHAAPTISPPVSRKKGKKKKRDKEGLSGLNALPPHANITLFQQNEPWINAVAELNSCTWNQVVKGLTVEQCHPTI